MRETKTDNTDVIIMFYRVVREIMVTANLMRICVNCRECGTMGGWNYDELFWASGYGRLLCFLTENGSFCASS